MNRIRSIVSPVVFLLVFCGSRADSHNLYGSEAIFGNGIIPATTCLSIATGT